MRTPTKHSTNVDTASTVVPIPSVVSRTSIASSSTESNSTSKSSSVRLLLNSNSDPLMPIQQQFTFFPNTRLQMNEQTTDRPFVISSALTSVKSPESDPKCGSADMNTSHFNPIIVNQPKSRASPQLMSPVQNADVKNFNRFTISGGSMLPTIMPNTNANTRVVSFDAFTHPSPNLLTTLRPGKRDSASLSSLPTVQVCSSSQALTESVANISAAPFLKASGLVSHSTMPSTSIEASQPSSLISVVPVDPSRNLQSSATLTSAIRQMPRFPVAVTQNRSTNTGILINRPTISRHPIVAPVSPLNSSSAGALNPSRKRSRKQQLLAPQGTEPANVTSVSSPTIEAALQSANSAVSLPVVNLAGSSTAGTGQVVNVRLFPMRGASAAVGKEGGSHFEQVSFSAAPPIVNSQFHSLVVSSSANANDEAMNAAPPSSSTSTTSVAATSTASAAASLVTASSFPSSGSSLTTQTSMYVFPSTVVPTPLRPTPTATVSTSNVLQVRFRASTPTRSPLANAFTQQTVRTVLSPSVTNNLQPSLAVSPPAKKMSSVDWTVFKSTVTTSTLGMISESFIAPEEDTRKEPAIPVLPNAKQPTPIDTTSQPTVPIVRVSDMNSWNCFDSHDAVSSTSGVTPQLKRPRKQGNSASGIKKQCTWELRTDPMDSNKSVWRSPQDRGDQQLTSRKFQGSDSMGSASSRKVDLVDSSNSTIHGCPQRMHLYKSIGQLQRLSGFCKGPKANHFLRLSELRFRPDSSVFGTSSSSASRHSFENDLQLRRQRDQLRSCPNESVDLRAIFDILETRNQQADYSFVNHPVDTTSPLDLTCWRLHWCLRNCDTTRNLECDKLQKLTSAMDRIFQRNRVERATGQEVPRFLYNPLSAQAQNLLTQIFLQAIPPASPVVSNSNFGAECRESVDRNEMRNCTTDNSIVEERTRGLIQRIKTLIDGIERINELSNELLTEHATYVHNFIEEIEYLRQNGGSGHFSSPRSPQNDGATSNSGDDGSDFNEFDEENDISESGSPPKRPRSPPSRGRGGSDSPLIQKDSSPVRATFQNGRRR